MVLFVTLLLILCVLIVLNFVKTFQYWRRKGVKCLTPLPFIGNSLPTILKTLSMPDLLRSLYNAFPTERYFGIFQLGQPILVIKDPELIKKITIKEFDSFSDHASVVHEELDPFWGKNLFASQGRTWKNLRQTLSPVFTSSKIKSMYILMEESTNQLMDHLNEQNADVTEWELYDLGRKFTMSVIATTAFGLQCNTLKEDDNEFFRMGRELTDFTGLKRFKFLMYSINPYVTKILNIKMVSDNVSSFFHSIIKQTMATRTKEKIVRPDLIQLLMEVRRGQLKSEDSNDNNDSFATAMESDLRGADKQFALSLTDVDITAQSLLFIFGGYDTTSGLINFCAYELAVNPDVQEKLRGEVDMNFKKHNGKITYEDLLKMKYLDTVMSETLRKWPAGIFLDRKTVKPFTIEPEREGEKPLHLRPGDVCWIPAYAIHRDPKYWPNPDVFDPDRFSEENRSKINPFTYLPFGSGPRNCIGSRYALILSKLLIFHLLARFEIQPTETTHVPLVIAKNNIILSSEYGFRFGFKRRSALEKH